MSKTTFILHGGFTSSRNEQNNSFYEAFSKDVSDCSTILLIYFSRKDEEEVSKLFEQDKERILEQAEGKELNIVLANESDFEDQIKQADVLYMRGGNTDKLLDTLKQYPNFGELVKGKVVAGSSAGAYAITTYGAGHSVNRIREGLGLLPLRLVYHYQSSDLPPTEESLSTLKETSPELELIFLKDHEWVAREIES